MLEITTKLESPSDTVVSEICEAVFALDSETRNGIEAVRVIGSDGEEGGVRVTLARPSDMFASAE